MESKEVLEFIERLFNHISMKPNGFDVRISSVATFHTILIHEIETGTRYSLVECADPKKMNRELSFRRKLRHEEYPINLGQPKFIPDLFSKWLEIAETVDKGSLTISSTFDIVDGEERTNETVHYIVTGRNGNSLQLNDNGHFYMEYNGSPYQFTDEVQAFYLAANDRGTVREVRTKIIGGFRFHDIDGSVKDVY